MPSAKYTVDTVNMKVSTPLYRKLCACAAGRRVSVNQILEELLTTYLAKSSGPIETVWPPRVTKEDDRA
jgi:predicted HicB family RNase H-like nuclease